MSVLIATANTFLEHYTFNCHLLHVSAFFCHRQVEFTTYMEKNTELVAFPSQLIHSNT